MTHYGSQVQFNICVKSVGNTSTAGWKWFKAIYSAVNQVLMAIDLLPASWEFDSILQIIMVHQHIKFKH